MPLRSAKEFPRKPDPEALEAADEECLAALVSANRSGGRSRPSASAVAC